MPSASGSGPAAAELARGATTSAPLSPVEFDRLMAALGPFETSPEIAVAVSGGPDSLALVHLAQAWAAARGGRVVALTVDHGLRAGSAAEARQVGGWLRARGIAHHILRWRGERPAADIQAAARAARYRLLEDWCGRRGILHLLLAHQRDDQAETLLLRLGRGSGVDGLAAMAPSSETRGLRLLRPLLTVPRARLVATLEAARQPWLEDPSNRDPRHARVRARALLPALAREGLTPDRLAATAGRLGRARQALETATASLLARSAVIHPAGYGLLEPALLAEAPAEIGLRALARLLTCLGAGAYPPRLDRLERLHAALQHGRLGAGRTLAGCRILPLGSGGVLICRECEAIGPALRAVPGAELRWDERFLLGFARHFPGARGAVRVEALGDSGWAELVRQRPSLRGAGLPAAVRPGLPALRDLEGLLAVPHLSYGRSGDQTGTVYVHRLAFRPPRPLAIGPVAVA